MKKHKSMMAITFLFSSFLVSGLTSCTKDSIEDKNASPVTQAEPRYTYHEFDMIVVFYKTTSFATYQKLLPEPFEMPADPMVRVFVADYYEMDAATEPYQEAAVFLLANHKGKPAWYCVTMPVTSDEARLGGIYFLGFPKIMGDINLERSENQFKGTLKLKKKAVMSLTLNTGDCLTSPEDAKMFEWLKDIPSLNIKDGEVFEPKFGNSGGGYTLLQLSEMFPAKLEVKVGKPDLAIDAAAAADCSKRLGEIFSIHPTEMVMGFYLKNKFVSKFNQ